MAMPGRKYEPTSGYRYGFNGKEKDKDIGADDYDFGARIYDGRIGRWLSVDAYSKAYPGYSCYSYGLNSPLLLKDEGGNWITDKDGKPIYTTQGTSLVKHGDDYYLVENRTYFTNNGKEVKATKYLSMLKKGDYTEVGKNVSYDTDKLMSIPQEKLDNTYDCHGNTCFKGQYTYIPGGDEKGSGKYDKNPENIFRNSSEYESINESDLKAGDVALFGVAAVPNPLGAGGGNKSEEVINHSATYNGDKTYTSKDDRAPLNTKATPEKMAEDWGGEILGYVRYKGDQNGGVESKDGLVTDEVAKTAIKNVKLRIDPKGAARDAKREARKEAKKEPEKKN